MDKIFFSKSAAITTMAIISTFFFACQKDHTDTMGIKLHKSMDTEYLQAFEDYTPNESTVSEQLLTFTNYVNNPIENPMPNMELKEAVWFAETFFNIGICLKQKQYVEHSNATTTFTITVPFEEQEGEILLNGAILQEQYNNMLNTVVITLCSESSLDFGDVYVKAIRANNTVDIGLDVIHGPKGERCFLEKGINMIIPQNEIVLYPNSPDPVSFNIAGFHDRFAGPDTWLYAEKNYLMTSYYRDPHMELVLNNYHIPNAVTGIKHVKKMTAFDIGLPMGYNAGCQHLPAPCMETIHAHGENGIYAINITPLLTKAEYKQYGRWYRDYIYSDVYPTLNLSADEIPFRAACFFLFRKETGMFPNQLLWQEFGIEYTCRVTDKIGPMEISELGDVIYKNPYLIACRE